MYCFGYQSPGSILAPVLKNFPSPSNNVPKDVPKRSCTFSMQPNHKRYNYVPCFFFIYIHILCEWHRNQVLLTGSGLDVCLSVYICMYVCVFPAVWQKGWQVCRQRFDRRLMRKLSQDRGFAQVTHIHTHTHTVIHSCTHSEQWRKLDTFVWQLKYLNPIIMFLQYPCLNYSEIALR